MLSQGKIGHNYVISPHGHPCKKWKLDNVGYNQGYEIYKSRTIDKSNREIDL